MKPVCPYCGSGLDADAGQAGGLPGTTLCPTCGQEVDLPGQSLPPPPLPSAQAEPGGDSGMPAWEGRGGFFSRLVRTTGQVLGHPVLFFSSPFRRGYAWALSYGLILGTIGTAGHVLWGHYFGYDSMSFRQALWTLIFSPLEVLVTLFISTWILHLFLLILGGAKNGVRATFRLMAYSQATGVLMLLPYVGIPLGVVWWLVVAIGGLAAAHGIGKGRAFLALIFPFLLLVALIVAAVLAVVMLDLGAELGNLRRHIPSI